MTALMRRRRALMGAKKARLPAGYQEVEWIEGKKAPAIITPVWLTLDTEIEVVGQQMELQNGYLSEYGCASPTIGLSYSNNTAVYVNFGNVRDQTGGSKVWQNQFRKIIQNKSGWWLDGVLQSQYNATSVSVNTDRKIAVFARTSEKNSLERFSWWRIKSFIVRQAGETVCDLIPCYRKSDVEIGMYDLVSKTFLTNAGNGSFTKGADVT